MSVFGSIGSFIGGIFGPAADLIDNLHTSDDIEFKQIVQTCDEHLYPLISGGELFSCVCCKLVDSIYLRRVQACFTT